MTFIVLEFIFDQTECITSTGRHSSSKRAEVSLIKFRVIMLFIMSAQAYHLQYLLDHPMQ